MRLRVLGPSPDAALAEKHCRRAYRERRSVCKLELADMRESLPSLSPPALLGPGPGPQAKQTPGIPHSLQNTGFSKHLSVGQKSQRYCRETGTSTELLLLLN